MADNTNNIESSPDETDVGLSDPGARIFAEQVDTAYRQIPGIIFGPSAAGAMMIYLYIGHVPGQILWSWFALVLLTASLLPAILYFAYLKNTGARSEPRRWFHRYTLLGFSGGSTWGSAGYLFFLPEHAQLTSVLYLMMFTAAAGAMAMTVAHRPTFLATAMPMLIPISIRSLMETDPTYNMLAAIALVYGSVLIYFHSSVHNTLLRSLALQIEKGDLASALSLKKEEAERANQDKSRFLAAASHDLRQPLHAQGLFLAELQNLVTDPQALKIIASMDASMEALNSLLGSLLDVSRLDAGVIRPVFEDFEILPLLERMHAEYIRQAREKNLKFSIRCSGMTVYSDRVLLVRILNNLIINAVRYTKRGGVLVGCRRRGDHLLIQVWDTGMGIPQEELQNVFLEFHQLHNPERDRKKGIGLGLAIVQRLAQLLDCEINVRSVVGRGSVFSLSVPVGDPARSDARMDGLVQMAAQDVAGMRVLVIDDETAIQRGMTGLLQGWGCDVRVAGSAGEALGLVNDWGGAPDAIVADYRLRDDETGSQAIDRLRERLGKTIPAMLITGDTAPDRLQQAMTSGHHLLTKPVHPARLRSLLSYLRNPA